MTTMTDVGTAAGAVPVRQVLRRTSTVWRRAGVRGRDRRLLMAELQAELEGAAVDGLPASAVLGDDYRATARAWADARDLTGRSLHAAWLVPVGLLAFSVATLVLAFYLIASWGGTLALPDDFAGLDTVIVVTGAVLGVGLPLQAVWAGLMAGRDPRAQATALWLLVTLPLGEVGAFLLALNVPTLVGSRLAPESVAPSVLAAMAAALLLGRWLAVRRPRSRTSRGEEPAELRVPPEWGAA